MKNQQDVEKAVEQTLNSLNNLQQLEANEYLHAKILQRINDNNKVITMNYNRVMLRLAAVLVLFIGINCASYYIVKQHGATTSTKNQSGADAFANAYNLNNNMDSY